MKVSVALVTYNSHRFLRPQIDTILANLGPDDEIVVSDDGSTDDTLDILNEYASKDSRFRIFQIEHRGCNGNYENAIAQCAGDIIFLSDDDNVWEPNKVKTVLKAFEENPKVWFVQHDCEITDGELNQISPSFFQTRKARPGLIRNIMRVSYGGSLIAFKREMLNYALPFPKKMPVAYDEWLGLIASKHGKVLFLPIVLSKWRRYAGTQSTGYVSANGTATTRKRNPLKGTIKRTYVRITSRLIKFWWAIRY